MGALSRDIRHSMAASEAILATWTRSASCFGACRCSLISKFGLETMADLGSILAALGMPDAFDRNRADFSGITTQERLSISAVIHQANLALDEKGTEASAATAVLLQATALPLDQVTVQVDHPFLFALRDTKTGAILFLGRVTEPKVRA
jgi:serpin B